MNFQISRRCCLRSIGYTSVSLPLLFAGCSSEDRSVIIHDYIENQPPTYEYSLPVNHMPNDVRKALHPDFQPLVGATADETREWLASRWNDVQEPASCDLRDLFLTQFRPRSLMMHERDAWICIARPNSTESYAGNIVLVPPETPSEIIAQGLSKFPFTDTPTFREFAKVFGALHEHMPSHAGGFRVPAAWETLFDYWGENTDGLYADWYGEWSQALVIYVSSVGDMLLLHPTGKLSWMDFAQSLLWEFASSFATFLERYVEYRRSHMFGMEGDIAVQS